MANPADRRTGQTGLSLVVLVTVLIVLALIVLWFIGAASFLS